MLSFLFILALLSFLIVVVKNSKLAFYLLPVFFVTYIIKFQFFGLSFSFLEVLIDLFFVIWFVKDIWIGKKFKVATKQIFSFKFSNPIWLIILFFIISTISLVFVPKEIVFNTGIKENLWEIFQSQNIALGIWKGWMIPILLFSIMFIYFIKDEIDKKKLLFSYVLSAFFVASLSLFWKYSFGFYDTADSRLSGIFVSANYLAFFIAPAFVYLSGVVIDIIKIINSKTKEYLEDKFFRSKIIISFIIWAVLAIAIFLTQSYASWIAIILCISLYLFIQIPKKWKFGSILIGILIIGLLFLSQVNSEKFQKWTQINEQTSTSTRLEVYQISLTLLKDNWLKGIGMGQYEAQYITNAHQILGKTPYEWVMLHPHNIYLSVWLSLGIFGFILFLIIIILSIVRTIKYKECLIFLPLLYILIHGFVDTPFWKFDNMIIFFMLMLIVLINIRPITSTEQ